ncbi:MAG TPA: glycosyltransferase [Bryobacteraceae bacterium]|nr:glycosyltransferase [Bryobacteraceae bacterium]
MSEAPARQFPERRQPERLGSGVAVLIPCFNEEPTVGEVVRQFRAALPGAEIYVFDNNSSDRTAEAARQAGAGVLFERRRGKGYVVQSMFRKIKAEIYLIVDGDGTYPAEAAARLIEPVRRREADMVIGSRLAGAGGSEFRWLNRLGNRFFLVLLQLIFGVRLTDLLSGYRCFSRRLVRGLPLFGGGFETEAEMTIKALQRGFAIIEVPVQLGARPPGSRSKIRLVQDGFVILSCMLVLLRDYKPLTFFGGAGTLLLLAGAVPAVWAAIRFSATASLPVLPLLVAAPLLAGGLAAIIAGLLLHSIARRFQELDHQIQTLSDDVRPED